MERFWAKRAPQFTEEDAYEYIKGTLKDYDDEDYYQRGSSSGRGSSSSSNRGGGSSSSYHEDKQAKLEKLAYIYNTICDFFEEIGIDPKSLISQGQPNRRY